MTDTQVAQLQEVLELAKTTEQKAKELAEFTIEIDRKYKQRLAQLRVARKLRSKRETILTAGSLPGKPSLEACSTPTKLQG